MLDHYTDMPSFLASIRHRPPMYLGCTRIRGLRTLLDGFWLAEEFHDIPEEKRMGGFDHSAFEK